MVSHLTHQAEAHILRFTTGQSLPRSSLSTPRHESRACMSEWKLSPVWNPVSLEIVQEPHSERRRTMMADDGNRGF